MDKLELKDIAPYLPYSVFLMNEYGNCHNTTTHKCISLESMLTDYKMCLRPMSDLTKEITHNGETFVPLKRITKEYYDKDNETIFSDESLYKITDNKYCYPSNGDRTSHWWLQYKPTIKAFDNQEIEGCLPQYDLFQELLKYHFDVNDLIGRGLAINLNEVGNGK
ncbi:hypothetical protein [Elizabethkingia ursingii]|uniref:hypothetical protein n=1 Tax=Elizabethkingia ursingii TaxID=1756150 RepID=UPI0007518293|nr:hypothetical protein [Elizabethkingia ursingii]KUY28047.1 hypothetical protein ATB96_19620 [Elizabethkingia ursingii]